MGLLKLPSDTQRSTVIGKTGSGKTIAALWQLSQRSFDRIPWIIFDFKRDDNIAQIPYLTEIDISDDPPEYAGLYVVRPLPDDNDAVEQFMWNCWAQKYTGLYFDEGYMIGNRNKAFRAILTQGRSLRLPLITLSQRPLWMDRFVFSEADMFQVFYLNDKDDRNVVKRYIPDDHINLDKRLPEHYSFWYDVGQDYATVLKPVPPLPELLKTFEKRLEAMQPKHKTI